MVILRESNKSEVPFFVEMEQLNCTSEFIIPYSTNKHLAEMSKNNVIYLSILTNDGLSGFIILIIDGNSVEFRRIVVSHKENGIGQKAIKAMEYYCSDKLGCHRIWLDVFQSNQRGKYIYQKLGYEQFKSEPHGDNILLYMDKKLNNSVPLRDKK